MKRPIQKILVIRFRQIGDSILALPLCSTLKSSFPDAQVHLVLNKGIAPLYEGHPDIDRVVTFDRQENERLTTYLRKVWRVVHEDRYDVIIDMRSTIRTLLFSLFSLHTPFRIGRRKSYTHGLLTHAVDTYDPHLDIDMVQRNLLLARPLETVQPLHYTPEFRLSLTDKEREEYRRYMERQGIDFTRPVVLVGVTTKLQHKKWRTEYMIETLKKLLKEEPDIQLIFNYAPGQEETDARTIYHALDDPQQVKIDVQATSLRELAALCANCSFYFGNEGGTRHIAQAMGTPSFAIFSPTAQKSMWLPLNSVFAAGICPADLLSPQQPDQPTHEQQFDALRPEAVYEQLRLLLARFLHSY